LDNIGSSPQLSQTLVQVGRKHKIIYSSCIKVAFELFFYSGVNNLRRDEIIFVIV